MRKIGVYIAVVAGVFGIADISVKIAESLKRKWYLHGFEVGKCIGSLIAEEDFDREKNAIQEKIDRLCEEYDELEKSYNELLDYYEDEL